MEQRIITNSSIRSLSLVQNYGFTACNAVFLVTGRTSMPYYSLQLLDEFRESGLIILVIKSCETSELLTKIAKKSLFCRLTEVPHP